MSTDTYAAEVGRNVRAEMGRKRISMTELARRTGVSRSTLTHQIDNTRITVDNLQLIADALGTPTSKLLGEVAS